MIRRSRLSREILEAVWERLEPIGEDQGPELSPRWIRRAVPMNGELLLAELQERFENTSLIETGIVSEVERELHCSPRLIAGTPVVALYGPPGDQVFDFLLPDGLLLGEESLIYATAHDSVIQHLLRSCDGMLLVVATFAEVQVCHRLGLAAIPTGSGGQLSLSSLRQIAELTCPPNTSLLTENVVREAIEASPDSAASLSISSVDIPDETVPGGGDPAALAPPAAEEVDDIEEIHFDEGWTGVDLTIGAWSFVRFEKQLSGPIEEFVEEIKEAQRHLHIDLSNVALWVPSQDEVGRLRYCQRLNDDQSLREVVLESMNDSRYSLLPSATVRQNDPWEKPETFSEVRRALWKELQNPASSEKEREELISEFQRLLDRDMIEPLVQTATSHRDPVLGALHLQFASTVSLLQSNLPALQRQLNRIGCSIGAKDRFVLDWNIRTHLKLNDSMMKIARELRR